MAKKFHRVDVAPLTVLPFRKAVYSYLSSEKLKPGTIVTVPLSGQILSGVVLSENMTHSDGELKEIISRENLSPLTQNQLRLAEAISNTTITSLGKVLKHFIPKKVAKRKVLKKKLIGVETFTDSKEKQRLTKEVTQLLQNNEKAFLELPLAAESREKILSLLFAFLKKKDSQVLLLVPDVIGVIRIEELLKPFFQEEELVSLYHAKKGSAYHEAWQGITAGKAKIIIATRHGIFAPYKNLTHIIQIDPSDDSYQQWAMSPRFHVSSLIASLQEIYSCKFLEISSLPSLQALQEKTPSHFENKKKITPEFVNLKLERFKKNWSSIAENLDMHIRAALREKKQVLFFIHQGGMGAFSICTECRNIFRCPSCKSALKLSKSESYHCKNCSFRSSLFPSCPHCKGLEFTSVGFGAEKVAKEVKKLFPGANIHIGEKEQFQSPERWRKYLQKTNSQEPDIYIATSSFTRFPPLSRLSLVAIIDADSLLNLPGFRKDEQFLEIYQRMQLLLPPTGSFFVQTFQPESDFFQKIVKNGALSVLGDILQERKLLHYPPFYRLFALEPRPSKKKVKEELTKITKELKTLIGKDDTLKKTIFLQTAARKERGREIPYTLLRSPLPLHSKLQDFLEQKSHHILIHPDPRILT